ncbi:PQQ-dependent sugar dehydrogenase [Mucilaginibacter sp. 21P]|uniref:c-type cytochrome n=1 Tax=Mucilaginibacter sp. 21P TaxID=2778902 RepID=UPI001C55E94F|nr:c-type cytochrome [Mucilaginibacter sp. 21P]QXV67462.1 PQQ-dependent sugar dehydrogenase [Mucilaginibacter sp. 21P]
MRSTGSRLLLLIVAVPLLLAGIADKKPALKVGDLSLPKGFKSITVADTIPGAARHLAVSSSGDIYVKLRFPDKAGGNAALRDTNGDGRADIIQKFADYEDKGTYGTAMRIYNGYLYFSSETNIFRIKLDSSSLIPQGEPELIIHDTGGRHEHDAKPIAFDDAGHIYVPFGAASNACQEKNRVPGSPGIKNCPLLDSAGGIWQFDANKLNQTPKDGVRYATGLRSVVAMAWNHANQCLYVVAHGRDDLHMLFPKQFNAWQSAVLPAEEFLQVKPGTNAGWPYYYYDPYKKQLMLNPEYGGNGIKKGDGAKFTQPIMAFPAHWAPNDLLFYKGNQFPSRYRNGAFIAFHGSTNRSPYPQAGYCIAFVPFKNGKPSGPWELFADGFTGKQTILSPSEATYRPMGLAEAPDGSLVISDTEKGRVWRVNFAGNKASFGPANLQAMLQRKRTLYKDPNPITDDNSRAMLSPGASLYRKYCISCHQPDGKGDGNLFPPLAGSEWVVGGPYGDKRMAIQTLLKGLQGPVTVKGHSYNSVMPSFSQLSDKEIAEVLTYIRSKFGNNASMVTAEEVKNTRKRIR